jgi:cell division protein FtsB
MREFQDKKRLKQAAVFENIRQHSCHSYHIFCHATWGVYKKEKESAANALAANSELTKLEDRQQLLDSEIQRLNTDEGVEEEIRSKYSVSKPGESMVIIVDKDKGQVMPVQQKEGWWDKFKKLFK